MAVAPSQVLRTARKTLIAVAQMNCTNDRQRNLSICEDLIGQAVKQNASMVFLPECLDYVAENKHESVKMAEELSGPTVTYLKNLASKHSVWLSLGGLHEKVPNHESIHISHVIINANGDLVTVYRKLHLFDVDLEQTSIKESSYTTPGQEIVSPVETPLGNLGLLICYDMRFPEISIAQRLRGAHCLTYPSAFTKPTGLAHWHTLLKARAIENQCYVIAAAQAGKHNANRESYGHALVVDPWGTVVSECGDGNTIALAEIDLDFLEKVRSRMPVVKHKRYDVYNQP